MTIPQLAARHGLTRQQMHRLATEDTGDDSEQPPGGGKPRFPRPSPKARGTRAKYDVAEVDQFMANRVVQPGRRTDLERKRAAEEAGQDSPADGGEA